MCDQGRAGWIHEHRNSQIIRRSFLDSVLHPVSNCQNHQGEMVRFFRPVTLHLRIRCSGVKSGNLAQIRQRFRSETRPTYPTDCSVLGPARSERILSFSIARQETRPPDGQPGHHVVLGYSITSCRVHHHYSARRETRPPRLPAQLAALFATIPEKRDDGF